MKDPFSATRAEALPHKRGGGRIAPAAACDSASRHGDKQPVADWALRWLAGLYVVVAGQVMGQVPNDDCANALDIETNSFCVFFWEWQTGLPGTLAAMDSTDLAVPDFPYPVNGLPCSGYANSLTAPSKDLWYRYVPHCYGRIRVQNSDSLQLSLFHGPSCAMLVPWVCYTLLPGENFISAPFSSIYGGYFYLQVSGPTITSDSRFEICIQDMTPPCVPAYYTYDTPTPVICMQYEAHATDATGQTNQDGTAQIVIIGSEGPVAVLWHDGDTASYRNDMAPGWHAFSLTDTANGCSEQDSVFVGVDLLTNMQTDIQAIDCHLHYHDHQVTIRCGDHTSQWVLEVTDAAGRMLHRMERMNAHRPYQLPRLATGALLLSATDAGGQRHVVRRVVMNR